jgi:hypothetical protein
MRALLLLLLLLAAPAARAAEDEAMWDKEQDDEMNAFPRMEGYLDGGFYEEDGDGYDADFPDPDFQ